MIFHHSLLCRFLAGTFFLEFWLERFKFWDFSDPQIFPKNLMAIPSPRQKSACSQSVMWRSIDRLYSLMGRFSVLKYLALEPHSPPTSAPYCWFSHDVTKIQTKKLSILPRFYFHDALQQLKANFHTNFRFKRALGFVIAYA